MDPPSRPWWGKYEIPDGQAGLWRIGPLTLTAYRQAPEWHLAHGLEAERLESEVEVACPIDRTAIDDAGEVVRVMSNDESRSLALGLAPADRPVVARPETAIRVLPGARIRLFVSIPVWVRVEIEEASQAALDLPSWRLSDTWFGPSTGQGELCYAVHTSARLHLENLLVVGHRAITEVLLENRTSESLSLERLNLPAPHLSFYADAEDHLWTQAVTVRLEGQGQPVDVDLGKGPPGVALEPRLVAEPRAPLSRNILKRTIGTLFQ